MLMKMQRTDSRWRPVTDTVRWLRLSQVIALLVVMGGLTCWCRGQTVTQTLTLRPGWNAVFLEVEPADNSPAAVFAGVPIESVWTRADVVASAEFIQDPSERAFSRASWLGWFAPGRPDAFLSNLQALQAHRAYLIKLGGGNAVPLSVTGSTAFRRPVWVADAYTLQGFPVDEESPPTFGGYFESSAAHFDVEVGASSFEAYRLTDDQWIRVAPGETIHRGEAYWVYTRGVSDFAGPFSVQLDLGDGLRYADDLAELSVNFDNPGPSPVTVSVDELTDGGARGLSYYQFSPTEGSQWLPLTASWTRTVPGGQRDRLRLAIRRGDLTAATYASVLRVRDGAGSEWLIPVSAERQDAMDAVKRRAGLWLGTATINAVSEVHSVDPDTPTPTPSAFSLRLLIHLDADGRARLLKQVIQMWQDGTTAPNAEGDLEVVEPGRYVLLTDDRLIGSFSGATLRDGKPVGRRLSAVGYDFAGAPHENYVELEGDFDLGKALTCTLSTPVDHPTNPYVHKYHPDHDNLTARFDGPAEEGYATSRVIELEFTPTPPQGTAPTPDYGYSQMGGVYRETIVGLHKQPLKASGQFSLNRISLVAELNPNP